MAVLTNIGISMIIGLIAILMPIIANIVQNGRILKDSQLKSPYEIVGKERVEITKSDLLKLTKKETFQLFQTLPEVDNELLNSKYNAKNLPQAALSFLVQFITDHLFGPGRWIGKGFVSDKEITGYNIFLLKTGKSMKGRRFKVTSSISEIDKRNSTKLDYRGLNSGIIAGSMRDELRMINSKLLLGMGMTAWGLGSKNPAHFILYKD